eukprot:TRINITY_DN13358_c0_g1_i1.p1 TRINITY_DN13358_c0_g1~~TRINITY_DN13358_c0_g1_i1.p1  ORF type:complete len:213 (+),score=20.71 TRINITY_DN13358_c0_g1_i1:28-666(+)
MKIRQVGSVPSFIAPTQRYGPKILAGVSSDAITKTLDDAAKREQGRFVATDPSAPPMIPTRARKRKSPTSTSTSSSNSTSSTTTTKKKGTRKATRKTSTRSKSNSAPLPDADGKRFECEICGKRFKQKGNMKTHMRTHTGEKPFTCDICGRGFRQLSNHQVHYRVHSGEKPYVCKVPGCNLAFRQSTPLRRHMVQDHRIIAGNQTKWKDFRL